MAEVPPADAPLVLVRVVNAPRERVFLAWTQRADLERWYTPGDGTWRVRVTALDVAVGGRYVVEFAPPGATVPYVETGEYVALEPPARLVFRNTLTQSGRVIAETMCTVELRALGGQTEVTVTETGFPPDARDDRRQGWGQTLDHLVVQFA